MIETCSNVTGFGVAEPFMAGPFEGGDDYTGPGPVSCPRPVPGAIRSRHVQPHHGLHPHRGRRRRPRPVGRTALLRAVGGLLAAADPRRAPVRTGPHAARLHAAP